MILPWWVNLLALAVAGAGGWHAHTIWDKAEERDKLATVITSMQVDQQETLTMSRTLQDSLASLKVTNTTIRNEVQREIVEKPVYRDVGCGLTPSGIGSLVKSIEAANSAAALKAPAPSEVRP